MNYYSPSGTNLRLRAGCVALSSSSGLNTSRSSNFFRCLLSARAPGENTIGLLSILPGPILPGGVATLAVGGTAAAEAVVSVS